MRNLTIDANIITWDKHSNQLIVSVLWSHLYYDWNHNELVTLQESFSYSRAYQMWVIWRSELCLVYQCFITKTSFVPIDNCWKNIEFTIEHCFMKLPFPRRNWTDWIINWSNKAHVAYLFLVSIWEFVLTNLQDSSSLFRNNPECNKIKI